MLAFAGFLGLGPLVGDDDAAAVKRIMATWRHSKKTYRHVRPTQDAIVTKLGYWLVRNEWSIIFEARQQLIEPTSRGGAM